MDRVRIWNQDGILIAQLRTSAERGYALVTEMSAKFYLSIYDSKCVPDILNYGCWVTIENSDGLLTWVGVIDGRGFEGHAAVIYAFTPERIFFYRRGPRSWTITGTAGEIFAQLIYYINSLDATPLQVGVINSLDVDIQETLRPVSILENLRRIVARSGEGYRWRPEMVDGKLTVFCDWYTSLVLDTGLILHDGYNISGDHPLTETAPINDVLTFGNGSNWNNRIISNVVDETSKQSYGLRQYSQNVPTPSQATLDATARVILRDMKEPKTKFPLSALNKGETFSKLEPGAQASLTKLVGQGFSEDGTGYKSNNIIVKSMNYDPAQGVVELAI